MTIDSRIDRRHALLGLLASAGALAVPNAASALSVATPEKAYAGFFLGQGGYWFSWGMPYLASQAQELGMETDIYEYTQVKEAWAKIKQKKPDMLVEALTGDYAGDLDMVGMVARSGLDVYAHNMETVEALTPMVRDRRAKYRQSLQVLDAAKNAVPSLITKTSIMLGLGETEEQLWQTLKGVHNPSHPIPFHTYHTTPRNS